MHTVLRELAINLWLNITRWHQKRWSSQRRTNQMEILNWRSSQTPKSRRSLEASQQEICALCRHECQLARLQSQSPFVHRLIYQRLENGSTLQYCKICRVFWRTYSIFNMQNVCNMQSVHSSAQTKTQHINCVSCLTMKKTECQLASDINYCCLMQVKK